MSGDLGIEPVTPWKTVSKRHLVNRDNGHTGFVEEDHWCFMARLNNGRQEAVAGRQLNNSCGGVIFFAQAQHATRFMAAMDGKPTRGGFEETLASNLDRYATVREFEFSYYDPNGSGRVADKRRAPVESARVEGGFAYLSGTLPDAPPEFGVFRVDFGQTSQHTNLYSAAIRSAMEIVRRHQPDAVPAGLIPPEIGEPLGGLVAEYRRGVLQ